MWPNSNKKLAPTLLRRKYQSFISLRNAIYLKSSKSNLFLHLYDLHTTANRKIAITCPTLLQISERGDIVLSPFSKYNGSNRYTNMAINYYEKSHKNTFAPVEDTYIPSCLSPTGVSKDLEPPFTTPDKRFPSRWLALDSSCMLVYSINF